VRTWKYVVSVTMITLVIIAVGSVFWINDTNELKATEDNKAVASWKRGKQDAPITIDMYPDFGCHVCIEKEIMVVEAYNKYPDEIMMVYHPYPSSGFSEKLAEALEAIGEQGKFWEFHDRIIHNVPEDMTALIKMVQDFGLDMESFNGALDSGKFTEIIRKAKDEAINRGVNDVAVFINGKEYQEYPGTLEDLYIYIDKELKRLGTIEK